ncbi:MAG: Trm112 family protein [Planctomycetota bacterium]
MPETPAPSSADAPAIDPKLMALLVCPLTRRPLGQRGDRLVCALPDGAELAYPIENGIPVLLIDSVIPPDGLADLSAVRAKYADLIPA